MLTLSERRAFDRAGSQEIERTVKAAAREVAEARERQREKRAAAIALADARKAAVPYTDKQLANARHVRDWQGWHKVVRVNRKSVTVGGPMWDERIPLDKILEVA